MDLPEIRKHIDAIDSQIVALLNDRARRVAEVGHLKKASGREIYAPEREAALLRKLCALNKGPIKNESLRAIYREIMSSAISLEKDIAIAFLGPVRSPSHQAAIAKFGKSLRYLQEKSLSTIFDRVRARKADYGVVPIETVGDGTVSHTLDLFAESPLKICAEIVTAQNAAAKKPHHMARFYVIGRVSPPPTGHDQTSLLFSLPDQPGRLAQALAVLSSYKINLLKIESRPSWRQGFKYHFFIKIAGHAEEPIVSKSLAKMSSLCSALQILGSYPESFEG
ncbi:MAG: chorismate mutase [Verrucomicrobiae bacterium]|nr:chorismate mutase [Verrucomicrobiae bacterium]